MAAQFNSEEDIAGVNDLLAQLRGCAVTVVKYQDSLGFLLLRVSRRKGRGKWEIDFAGVDYFCGPMHWEVSGLEVLEEIGEIGERGFGRQLRFRDSDAGFEVVGQYISITEK